MNDLVAQPELPVPAEGTYSQPQTENTAENLSQPLPAELERFSQATSGVSNIPGYKWMRSSYENGFHTGVRRQLGEFKRFKSISDETKERILPRVTESIAKIQAYEAWQPVYKYDFLERSTGVALVLGIASAVLSPFFLAKIGIVLPELQTEIQKELPGWLVLIATALASFIGYAWVVYRLWMWRHGHPTLSFLFLLTLTTLGINELTQVTVAGLFVNAQYGLELGLFGGWVFLATFLLAFFAAKLMTARSNLSKAQQNPEEEIIQSLCYALALVDDGTDTLPKKIDRRELARVLGWIGQKMETELFRMLSGQDMETNLWLQKRMRAMAADFRRMQQAVLLLTNLEEHKKMVGQLAEKLVNAADGNWGLFESIETADSKPTKVNAILGSLQTMIGFLFPVLIILVIEAFKLFSGEDTVAIKNSIYTTAIGWFLVNVVAWLDPKYETRLGGVKILTEAIKRKE